jgi:hypothetical protein
MRLTGRDMVGVLRFISLAMEVIDAEAEQAAMEHQAAQQAAQAPTDQAIRERLAAAEREAMQPPGPEPRQ